MTSETAQEKPPPDSTLMTTAHLPCLPLGGCLHYAIRFSYLCLSGMREDQHSLFRLRKPSATVLWRMQHTPNTYPQVRGPRDWTGVLDCSHVQVSAMDSYDTLSSYILAFNVRCSFLWGEDENNTSVNSTALIICNIVSITVPV